MWDPNKKLVQDANPMAPVAAPVPLSRDAFIDPKTGAEHNHNKPNTFLPVVPTYPDQFQDHVCQP